MEQIHVENISILIHFMETLADPRFNMEKFVHSCNAPACALGWATTIPALRDRGLMNTEELSTFRCGGIAHTVNVVLSVFGDKAMADLFSHSLSKAISTPQQWANHARDYLRAKGHGVVPADDGFKAFMAKALQAVALERA